MKSVLGKILILSIVALSISTTSPKQNLIQVPLKRHDYSELNKQILIDYLSQYDFNIQSLDGIEKDLKNYNDVEYIGTLNIGSN